ncbi:MAG: hypothetical protein IKN36_02990, partial [Clostridia bacterium]|nr:hypothetical protein [Clostridia bacterium]
MKLPALRSLRRTKKTLAAFGGYDRRPGAADGTWYDMTNMTADRAPALAVRGRRGTVAVPGDGEITGIGCALGKPAVTRGSLVVVGDDTVDLGLSPGPKKLVSFGAYLLVFPDGKYVNAATLGTGGTPEFGDIDASATVTSEGDEPNASTLVCTTCDENGNDIVYSRTVSTPQSPSNGDFWYDIGSTPAVLRQYRQDTDTWVGYEPYRKYRFDRAVTIPPGVGETVYIDPEIIRTQGGTDGSPRRGYFRLQKKGADFFVVKGPVINRIYDGFTVRISRNVPKMDFVTEAGNRLWGCRYGDVDGKPVNEIWASALGDFREWHAFENVSTDSYVASVGSDGPFTGAATYRGNPVFFKERTAHRVMGTTPSTFRISTLECEGAGDGSDGSFASVGGLLYYVSPSGVMRYDGSSCEKISAPLGDGRFSASAAGEYGGKYYVGLTGETASGLFVFDPRRRTWHREDGADVGGFCPVGSETYFFCRGGNALFTVGGSGGPYEDGIPWSVESGDFGLSSPRRRYLSRVTVKMSLPAGSRAELSVRYDGRGPFIPAAAVRGGPHGSFSIPIPLRRCGDFRIRISGVGYAEIFSVTLTGGEGSEYD